MLVSQCWAGPWDGSLAQMRVWQEHNQNQQGNNSGSNASRNYVSRSTA
jgi:hypothetical protein